MFPNSLIEPERGLVVDLDVGVHVANVAVADQVHVTKLIFNSTNVAFNYVASRACSFKLWNLISSHYNQSKTGVRMLLTSQIKKLEQIYKKLIEPE